MWRKLAMLMQSTINKTDKTSSKIAKHKKNILSGADFSDSIFSELKKNGVVGSGRKIESKGYRKSYTTYK